MEKCHNNSTLIGNGSRKHLCRNKRFPEPSGLFAVSSTCSATDIHLAGQCWSNVKHYLPLMAVHYFVTTSTLTIYSHFYHSACALNILSKSKCLRKILTYEALLKCQTLPSLSKGRFVPRKVGKKLGTCSISYYFYCVHNFAYNRLYEIFRADGI